MCGFLIFFCMNPKILTLFFSIFISLFLWHSFYEKVKFRSKFQNPTISPYRKKVTTSERERENAISSGQSVLWPGLNNLRVCLAYSEVGKCACLYKLNKFALFCSNVPVEWLLQIICRMLRIVEVWSSLLEPCSLISKLVSAQLQFSQFDYLNQLFKTNM